MPSSRDESGERSQHPLRRRRQVIIVYLYVIWMLWGILCGLCVEPERTELGTRPAGPGHASVAWVLAPARVVRQLSCHDLSLLWPGMVRLKD
jgi:hypothetical protein